MLGVSTGVTEDVRDQRNSLNMKPKKHIMTWMLRRLISWGLILLTPTAIIAQEATGALVHGTGSVLLNSAQLTNSSVVSTGDVVQTGANGIAYVSAPGSSALIESNSITRVQGAGLSLDRGSVSVATSKNMSVFARDFRIVPASNNWTEFYVTRTGGAIQIMARKNSVLVICGANTSTVAEGHLLSRNDAGDCGMTANKRGGAPAAATGPILSSKAAEYAALGVGVGLSAWSLAQSDDPVSPSKP